MARSSGRETTTTSSRLRDLPRPAMSLFTGRSRSSVTTWLVHATSPRLLTAFVFAKGAGVFSTATQLASACELCRKGHLSRHTHALLTSGTGRLVIVTFAGASYNECKSVSLLHFDTPPLECRHGVHSISVPKISYVATLTAIRCRVSAMYAGEALELPQLEV